MNVRIQRILAPVDDSEAASVVLTQAFDFAQRFRATLEVLHVWRAEQPPEEATEDGQERAHKFLAALFDACDQPFSVSVTPLIKQGLASDSILERAADTDLIIMAAARPSADGPRLGTTVSKVLGHSTCPVLVLRC